MFYFSVATLIKKHSEIELNIVLVTCTRSNKNLVKAKFYAEMAKVKNALASGAPGVLAGYGFTLFSYKSAIEKHRS